MIDSVPEDVESEQFGTKLECDIKFEGQNDGDPNRWTLNSTSRNTLIDFFGNDTSQWVGRKVPIESAITDKGRAIYADRIVLEKQKGGTLD